ncbi:DUF445 family protein [Aquibacillus sp. 3ASR75-11]|uniref:DUF445 family protein n=1 Tax=Terrihalobacillus insolitus TaxID=2950438 RepID=A0A9X3WWP0_9BACI|nr:DUF445 family protein [Terrihalobacillus insolitus]MDC3413544.1 DUF445 family protein [Terrihalobacillus insolitus]MDC3424699.1 DUF445 family protein [Terrihalobacillus insolitus]
MTGFLLVLSMIIIGAFIGGITNSLAIKMLFRPYHPIYFKKWKIPFTPGLIPKRRDELAKQLGRMVVEHLLTPEGFKKKLQQPAFQKQMIRWVQGEVQVVLESNKTSKEMLQQLGVHVDETELRQNLNIWVKSRYEALVQTYRPVPLHNVLNREMQQKVEQWIDKVIVSIQGQLDSYISGEDGRRKIGALVETYLEGKGFLGNMISSFLGNEGLADKIQPVIAQYVRSEEARKWIKQMALREWGTLLERPIGTIEENVGEEWIADAVTGIAAKAIPLEKWLARPVSVWAQPIKPYVLDAIVPALIDKLGKQIENRIEGMMQQLHLAEIVEKEVETFPIERVEQLVLSISKREFKMITYLGAFLGGIIGLIQGLLVLLLG